MEEGDGSGERKLLLAILKDAIGILLGYPVVTAGESRETLRHNALAWVESDEATSPVHFVRICHEFNLQPEYLRKRLRRAVKHGGVRKRTYWNPHGTKKKVA